MKIVIEHITTGRRITVERKRVCGKATRKRRKRKKCNRYKRVTTLSAAQGAGRSVDPVHRAGQGQGRSKAGRYRARITATDLQGARSSERPMARRRWLVYVRNIGDRSIISRGERDIPPRTRKT